MDHLTILQKICNNISDSLEPGTPIYIFAAAIYDTWWQNSTHLEQNLAKRLVKIWQAELKIKINNAYHNVEHQENRSDFDEYCKKWLENSWKIYKDNDGLRKAVWLVWEDNFGIRCIWPN